MSCSVRAGGSSGKTSVVSISWSGKSLFRFHVSGRVNLRVLDDGSAPTVYVNDADGGDGYESSDEDDEEFEGYRRDESECGHVEKPEVMLARTIASGIANNGEASGADGS